MQQIMIYQMTIRSCHRLCAGEAFSLKRSFKPAFLKRWDKSGYATN